MCSTCDDGLLGPCVLPQLKDELRGAPSQGSHVRYSNTTQAVAYVASIYHAQDLITYTAYHPIKKAYWKQEDAVMI